MKEGWEVKKLGEVCEIIKDGTHFTPDYADNGVVFLSSRNVKNNIIDWTNVKYVDEEQHLRYQARVSPKFGDVLLAKNGSIGNAAIVDRNIVFDIYVSLALLRPVGTCLTSNYLWYFIMSPTAKQQFAKRVKGIGVPNLHLREIREVRIPLISIEIQTQIVALLDKAFAEINRAKAHLEQNIRNAAELFQSRLNELFNQQGPDWEEKKLGEVCDLYQGLAINAKTKHLLVQKSPLPLLRIQDLRNGTESKYVNPEGLPKNCIAKEGDIIYTRTGSLGLVFRGRVGVIHNNSFKVEPGALLSRDYMFWWLQHEKFRSKILSLATRAAQPDITHKLFKAQTIMVPDLDTQEKTFNTITEINQENNSIIKAYQTQLQSLEELKQSLLERAFAGELS